MNHSPLPCILPHETKVQMDIMYMRKLIVFILIMGLWKKLLLYSHLHFLIFLTVKPQYFSNQKKKSYLKIKVYQWFSFYIFPQERLSNLKILPITKAARAILEADSAPSQLQAMQICHLSLQDRCQQWSSCGYFQ